MPATDVHPTEAELQAFTLGTLDGASASVEAHLTDCPSCQARAAVAPADTLVELLRSAHARPSVSEDTPAPSVVTATMLWSPTDLSAPSAPAELAGHARYRLLRQLGAGGMGAVWLAEHSVMGRQVALKVIRPEHLARPGAAERFRREVHAAACLHHPNIVTAHDADQAGATHFLVMEYVEGVSLAEHLERTGPLPVAEACRLARGAALGLQHAHEHGLIHRDVKPHNIMLTADGGVKILDFGLAALAAGSEEAARLTGANMVVGTPDYIAPEQAEDAHAADIRSDVYSLGCTLYHMLASRVPFPGGSVLRKLDAHRTRPPEPIRSLRLDVPPALAMVLAKMMAKDPVARYQTPAEVAAALEPFVRGGTARPRRRWPLAVAAAVLFAGLAAAAVGIYRVQTDNGELLITTESDDVEVVIKQNGKEIRVVDTKTDRSITLHSGVYELELKDAGAGLKLNIDKATLTRGETVLAKIERAPTLAGQAQSQPLVDVGEVRRFLGYAPSAWVTRAEFTPNGRRVVATNGSMLVWDAASGETVWPITDHTLWAWGLALAPDSKTAYESTDDGVVHIFDLEKAKEVGRLDAPGRGPTELELSADGKRLLIKVLHVWKVRLCEVPGGKELAQLQGNGPAALSPDGAQVALCRDKRVVLWDVASDKEAGGFEMNLEGRQLAALRFTPDGRFLVTAGSGTERNVVRLWDVATGKERSSFNVPDVHADTILRLGVSPDGRRILTGTDPRLPATNPPIILWDVETAKEVCRLQGPEGGVFSLAFSPDGRSAVVTGADGTVRLLRLPDPPPPEKVGEVRRFLGFGPGDWVTRAEFSPDGRRVVALGPDVRAWNAASGESLAVMSLSGEESGWGLALAPDGKTAYQSSDNGVVHVFDLEKAKEVDRLDAPGRGPSVVELSADGKRILITVVHANKHRLCEVPGGKELALLDAVNAALSPDGARVAMLRGRRIVLWDVASGKEVGGFDINQEGLIAFRFTPDGRSLVTSGSGAQRNVVRIWDVATGKERSTFNVPHVAADTLLRLDISPDGRRILTGTDCRIPATNPPIILWDVETAKEVCRLQGPKGGVFSVAFSPDGRSAVVTGADVTGADGTVRLYRLPDPPAAKDDP